MNDQPFALLITWTCYGTWLSGDRRGYVSNTRRPDGSYAPKQNVPGTPITADHALTRQRAASLQKYTTAKLDGAHARVAADALVASSAERGWFIPRAALMWNHVHVVIGNCPDDGPTVRRILKGVSQNEIGKFDGQSKRWWTSGGSDRYLHGADAIAAAIRYVANQSGRLAEIVDMSVVIPGDGRSDP